MFSIKIIFVSTASFFIQPTKSRNCINYKLDTNLPDFLEYVYFISHPLINLGQPSQDECNLSTIKSSEQEENVWAREESRRVNLPRSSKTWIIFKTNKGQVISRDYSKSSIACDMLAFACVLL